MNLEQVKLRREAINRRLEELNETQNQAQGNRRWYQSPFFARAVSEGRWDRLEPISDPEAMAALMADVLRT